MIVKKRGKEKVILADSCVDIQVMNNLLIECQKEEEREREWHWLTLIFELIDCQKEEEEGEKE